MCSRRMRLKTPPIAVSGWMAAEGALARPVGLREDALEVVPPVRGFAVADHEPLLAVAIGARGEPVAVRGLEVVEEDDRVLHLVGVGVDDQAGRRTRVPPSAGFAWFLSHFARSRREAKSTRRRALLCANRAQPGWVRGHTTDTPSLLQESGGTRSRGRLEDQPTHARLARENTAHWGSGVRVGCPRVAGPPSGRARAEGVASGYSCRGKNRRLAAGGASNNTQPPKSRPAVGAPGVRHHRRAARAPQRTALSIRE